jgi:DNA-binding SARP family transcriptional activator/tetratricopeptide (TPR) repeat protein
MTGIELYLLGSFEGRGPGGAPIAIAPKKVRALLAYLGFHLGKAMPREQLSALIWGDISAGEQARRSLRQALTTLRRELPAGALDARRDEVMLCPGAGVDVQRFEHGARQTQRKPLEQTLQLYRGELLEGFTARARGFDQWLERERKRLHALAADAMQRLCEVQRAEGDAAASMATAMRLVATDPVREAAHRLLMELYVEAGRASEAVRQFHTLRALLHEKLGTAPDAQTSDLLERIRRSSERRQAPHDSVPRPMTAGAPELRQACVLAIAPGEGGFDASLERDVEIVLARFGGSLMRVGEQRALAVFGFPRAHDNDLERGVRAALALCRLERLATSAAIGVASGPLLVEYDADKPVLRGEVLARASGLLELDGPGVRVTGAIACALGERLESRAAGAELDARWVSRCLGDVEVPCRTPFVGRSYELAQLTSALELCAQSRRGRTFIVRGEAGIGKTRLLRALCAIAPRQGFQVHARSIVDFGDDAREQPIQGIVRELLADQSAGAARPPASNAEALEEADLTLLLEMVREVSRSGSAHEAGGRALYLRARRIAACRLLASRSADHPRLIWIDDIHWADAETLAQIAAWIEVAASHPLLLMVTTRSEGQPDAGVLRELVRGRPATTLDLAPLTPEETRQLVLALEPGDDHDAEAVLTRAGGNPLFIEQLLRSPRSSRVPAGISSLVQARTDQLEPDDRSLLQAAGVLGHHFTLPALSHLLELNDPSLSRLIAQHLITEHGDGYAFVHALVRAAVYDGLRPEWRIRLHSRAARYYAGRDAALHAEHLDRAGDDGAARAYALAATSERRAGNAERALELCLRGRELAERAQDRHASALLAGELSIDLGRSEAALEAFAAALASASDAGERVRAHLGRAAALRVLDRSKEALLELAAAERQLDPQREPMLQSRIHYLRGNVLFPLGDWAACLQSQTLAFEAARRTGSTLAEAQALSGMADAHFLAGRWRTARTCFDRCEQVSRQVGALELELTSRGMRHLLDSYDLSFADSARGCREVAERSRASGSLRAEAVARLSAAWALLAVGDWEAALSEARRATSVADGIGAQRFSALGIAYSAIARARLGERQSAHADLTRALELARSSGMRFSGPTVYAALLTSAEDDRLPALLEEADVVIHLGCMSVMLVFFFLYGVEAALKVGDLARAARYADFLEASMREEPHALGALLIDFSRTLCAFRRDPEAENSQRELERLRQRLALAGLRPEVAFVEQSIARCARIGR